jgi:protein-tyrosine phosphatase
LYGVDDGAKTRKESIQMLKEAKKQNVEAMILTPHYRKGMFKHPNETIEEHFRDLKAAAEEIGIEIYLGTEFHVHSSAVEYLHKGRCRTLADTEYVLVEYGYDTEFTYIKSTVQALLLNGYIPVIAHAERYGCLREQWEYIEELRDIGAMIQINADAILGIDGFMTKTIVKKLLKKQLVDFVASDSHGMAARTNNLGRCREYLYKKYDSSYVDKILEKNARTIIGCERK